MPLKCEKRVRIPLGPLLMSIKLLHSIDLRRFKKQIGQANHFLITILIGLNEVRKGTAKKPDTMDVFWNPKDFNASAIRSEAYALNSSLAWVIDNFDAYVQNCNRNPRLIENKELLNEINRAKHRVNDKFIALYNKYSSVETLKLYGSLVALGIQWRNNTTHSEAQNDLDKEYENILWTNKEWYQNNCCNLDIERAYDSFKKHKTPTLKEVASIIKSVSRFVEIVDTELINELDIERYIREIFEEHFKVNNDSNDKDDNSVNSTSKQDEKEVFSIPKQDKRVLLPNLSNDRLFSRIKNILVNNGFSVVDDPNGFEVDEDFIKKYFGDYFK